MTGNNDMDKLPEVMITLYLNVAIKNKRTWFTIQTVHTILTSSNNGFEEPIQHTT